VSDLGDTRPRSRRFQGRIRLASDLLRGNGMRSNLFTAFLHDLDLLLDSAHLSLALLARRCLEATLAVAVVWLLI
jgi:hypothetical protein